MTVKDKGDVLGFKPSLYIGGNRQPSSEFFSVIDPSSEECFAECPKATNEQLAQAIAQAKAAQSKWAKVDISKRADAVKVFAERLFENKNAIAKLITREQGKPFAASVAEVQRAAESMLEICSIPIGSEVLREDQRGRVELHYKPLGVIAAITPWNVPIALGAPKIASAVYTGNTVILKPSSSTPFSSLLMAEITADVFPLGVFSVLTGGSDLGQLLCEHADIAKVNFTGSVPTGKRVMAAAAPTLKRLTLELGGNDAAIVLDDVDVDEIAPKLFFGAFGLAGQVCMAIKRLYVQESIYERVIEALSKIARETVLGNGFEEGIQMGPLQNKNQFEEVMGFIEDTKKVSGVRITAGGYALDRPGYFIAPTIVADIKEGTRLVDEEPFGPILPILSFKSVDEAIKRANDTKFGLGGSVWTRNIKRGAEIASQLDAGFTWVNHHVGTTRDLPFGGVKESGIGRNGGAIGVTSDMEAQVVFIPSR